MNSDADSFWREIAPGYRRAKGLCPMTSEEADAAFDEAPEIAMSDGEIQRIVDAVVAGEPPRWEPDSSDWASGENLDRVEEELLAVYREEGEPDAETDAKERELRNRMLSDEQSDEEGVDRRPTLPGEGGKDG